MTVPTLPTLRYFLSGWMLVLSVAAGSVSVSSATDPQNVDGVVPLALFCLFFLYVAVRGWRAGAVVGTDEVILRGIWRSISLARSSVTDVRVEPLAASALRRLLTGQTMMTHEVTVQVDGEPDLRLGYLGFAFVSEEGAAQFVDRLRGALGEGSMGEADSVRALRRSPGRPS